MFLSRFIFFPYIRSNFSSMTYIIRRILVWTMRSRHSRGFGVQSPSIYRFIRYVVNEHYPYYAYERLRKSITDIDKRTRKLCLLYFRISNYCQSDCFVDFNADTDAYGKYVSAGCRHTEVLRIDGNCTAEEYGKMLSQIPSKGFIRMSLSGNYREFAEAAIRNADSDTVLVVQDIKRDKHTKHLWKELIADSRTGISLDLYYCGIIFFDKERFKQNYIVNF